MGSRPSGSVQRRSVQRVSRKDPAAIEGQDIGERVEVGVLVDDPETCGSRGGGDDEVGHRDRAMEERVPVSQLAECLAGGGEHFRSHPRLNESIEARGAPVEPLAVALAEQELEGSYLAGRDLPAPKRATLQTRCFRCRSTRPVELR